MKILMILLMVVSFGAAAKYDEETKQRLRFENDVTAGTILSKEMFGCYDYSAVENILKMLAMGQGDRMRNYVTRHPQCFWIPQGSEYIMLNYDIAYGISVYGFVDDGYYEAYVLQAFIGYQQ